MTSLNTNPTTPSTLVLHDPAHLQWMPWAARGTHFKLLHADPKTGRYSMMIKMDKGAQIPMHRHVGAVEGIILDGSFHYHDQPDIRFVAGNYLLENDGATHRPISPDGAIMFAIFHGAVEGLDDDGNVTGRIDWKWHVDTWAAAHKMPPPLEN